MKIVRCEFEVDDWGLYILPLVGYSWNKSEKAIWIGWLKWLWKVHVK
jgi:hypothetical protein